MQIYSVQYAPSISSGEIRIIDLEGRVVKSVAVIPGSTQARIDLSGIQPGVYKMHDADWQHAFTRTILIQ
jgi:hypothetical protein